MTIIEYNKIKMLDYFGYVAYLLKKYGPVKDNYFRTDDCNSVTPNGTGLHRHHIFENIIANLQDPEIAKLYDFKYQLAEHLVYCNKFEHILLHILIAEETVIAELGRNGAMKLLEFAPEIDPVLKAEFLARLGRTGTLLKHNIDLYNEVKLEMATNNKALCTLATGGGKSTTVLQYLVDTNDNALVLGPKNAITDDWASRRKCYPQISDVMTYQTLMGKTEDEAVNYVLTNNIEVLIADEAHHLKADGAWTRNIKAILARTTCKLLGITAESKRTDRQRVADILFNGRECKGMTTAELLKSGVFHPISYVSTLLVNKDSTVKLDPACAYLQRDLDLALNTPSVSAMLRKYRPDYTKVKGIVFIPRGDGSGENFKEAREILQATYGPSVPIWEINCKLGAKKIKQIRDEFEKADYGFIISIDMLGEGIHPNGINTEIILRNSKSPLVVNQQIGRLARIKHDGEADPGCMLFDVVNIVKTIDFRDIRPLEETGLGEAFKETSKSVAVIYDDQCERLYKVLERSNAFKAEKLFPDFEVISF